MNPKAGCFVEKFMQYQYPVIKLPEWMSYEEGASLGVSVHTVCVDM